MTGLVTVLLNMTLCLLMYLLCVYKKAHYFNLFKTDTFNDIDMPFKNICH